jgi:hypothetical protein
VFRKLLWLGFGLLIVGRLLTLPRFKRFRERVDRAISATLLALALVYGYELIQTWQRYHRMNGEKPAAQPSGASHGSLQ